MLCTTDKTHEKIIASSPRILQIVSDKFVFAFDSSTGGNELQNCGWYIHFSYNTCFHEANWL
jgi:hypothetical protein